MPNIKCLFLAIATALAGCAGGPIDTPHSPALIQAALPDDAGEILLMSRGAWIQNSRGYSLSLSTTPPRTMLGVIVITDAALFFSEWDVRQSAYVAIKRVLRSDIQRSFVDEHGIGRRLVLQNRDLTFDTFEFGHLMVDREATTQAAQLLAAQD